MKFLFLAFFSLCFLACIQEYVDSIKLNPDGSAQFFASTYPCEPDSNFINSVKENYDSIEGIKFDSAWFSLKDSLYSLNFMLSFENLLSWQGNKRFEKNFIGNISLKKIDSTKNLYSFERVINPNTENEDGSIVPEESVSPFALELINKNDPAAYWKYTLILPQGANIISVEPTDSAYVKQSVNKDIIRWNILVSEAVSKRILLKTEFTMPEQKSQNSIHFTSLIGIVAGCIVMLLAIAMLIRRLKKLSTALNELKNAEKTFSGE